MAEFRDRFEYGRRSRETIGDIQIALGLLVGQPARLRVIDILKHRRGYRRTAPSPSDFEVWPPHSLEDELTKSVVLEGVIESLPRDPIATPGYFRSSEKGLVVDLNGP